MSFPLPSFFRTVEKKTPAKVGKAIVENPGGAGERINKPGRRKADRPDYHPSSIFSKELARKMCGLGHEHEEGDRKAQSLNLPHGGGHT